MRQSFSHEVPDRKRVMALVEGFVRAWEAAIVSPSHPLISVQELNLTQSQGGHVHATQKRTGRSQPPIRDMDPIHARTDRILRHISEISPVYRNALETFADTGSLQFTADRCRVRKRVVVDLIREGIVAFQSGWLLIR